MVDAERIRLSLFWTAVAATVAIIGTALALVVAGPTSNIYPVGDLRTSSSQYPGGKAFVRNPELSQELEILQTSGVFEIVSADQARKVIDLHPLQQAGGACGNPLLLTWATNGLVPATVRNEWTFSFTLEENGVVSERHFALQADRRISLVQHFFKPFHRETRTLGAILESEYACGQTGPTLPAR